MLCMKNYTIKTTELMGKIGKGENSKTPSMTFKKGQETNKNGSRVLHTLNGYYINTTINVALYFEKNPRVHLWQ